MRLIGVGRLCKQRGSKGFVLLCCLVGLAGSPLKSTFGSLRSQSVAFAGRENCLGGEQLWVGMMNNPNCPHLCVGRWMVRKALF